MQINKLALTAFLSAIVFLASATERFITFQNEKNALCLTGTNDTILYDANDWKGVHIAVTNLRKDLLEVTGSENAPIIVATIDKSPLAKRFTEQSKLLKGKTEQFLIFTSEEHLVILGSDKRGTIYGIYEVSRQIGVSPWHYWADVPSEKHSELYAQEGCYTDGEPKVRYRGIFINDEAPCTSTWVKNTFNRYSAGTGYYEKCFDLLLRLKANYMWPAMWMWSFYADDPKNSQLADDMGIMMGTSHHEPMARNHQEWIRHRDDYGKWNYAQNPKVLDQFFREGIERVKNTEDIITIGMRGDGDAGMDGGNNMELMKRIIKNQRRIISEVTKKPASKTPQIWALYKEVLEYYDKGLRVPDDVIYLLCDDNWGNIRRIPNVEDRAHKGGWGLYYHVDYVGGPRNAKWLNITPIQGMWEQLSLAYNSGIDKLWILNVGDLKPMEYPIDMFLNTAWYGPQDDPMQHLYDFCQQNFAEASINGHDITSNIASLINTYSKYAGRVTPEMLDADTYNVETGEWRQVANEFVGLEVDALRLLSNIKPEYEDCYQQLVLFPIQAMANIYQMYYAVAMNHYYGKNNDKQANIWAERAKVAFERDSILCHDYNKKIANGKWDGMMNQKHIGYDNWNDNFLMDTMPELINVGSSDTEIYTSDSNAENYSSSSKKKADPSDSHNYVTLWEGGPEFATITYDDSYAIPSDNYHTWEEAMKYSSPYKNEWRLPTAKECHELLSKCRSEWTSVNGVYGRTYKGLGEYSDNMIFIPASGFEIDERKDAIGQAGFQWSISETDPDHAYYFYWYSGEHHLFVDRKGYRYPILLIVKN